MLGLCNFDSYGTECPKIEDDNTFRSYGRVCNGNTLSVKRGQTYKVKWKMDKGDVDKLIFKVYFGYKLGDQVVKLDALGEIANDDLDVEY